MSLKGFMPGWYEGVKEFDVLLEVEDVSLLILKKQLMQVTNNQWIQTADETMISYHESLFKIIANPGSESLSFRRERLLNRLQSMPPYTLNYLITKLKNIFWAGNYSLVIDYNNYQLLLETAAENANWFNEVQVIIHKIKPANMVYIQVPAITEKIAIVESAAISELKYFRVGRGRLGREPLLKVSEDKEVILR